MRWLPVLVFAGILVLPALAQGQVTEIYKCVDDKGRPLYTSDKRDTAGKKCELVSREITVVPAPPKPAASEGTGSRAKSPAGFPKESPDSRAASREKQREILEREIGQERSLLAKAKQALAEQDAIRLGEEKNYARKLERLKPFQDTVEVHEKNIAALERELRNLYR